MHTSSQNNMGGFVAVDCRLSGTVLVQHPYLTWLLLQPAHQQICTCLSACTCTCFSDDTMHINRNAAHNPVPDARARTSRCGSTYFPSYPYTHPMRRDDLCQFLNERIRTEAPSASKGGLEQKERLKLDIPGQPGRNLPGKALR